MPIFISYSHADKDFVDRLAANIVRNRGTVWVDRWELNVGDSIVQKIQEAIAKSSALLVVLSKNSIESEWCKKELAAALTRELEENKVLVFPVLLENCDIPLFLRDKQYADFRTDFDSGLKGVLEAVAAVSNSEQSRLENAEHIVDWAEDWWFDGPLFRLRTTVIETPRDLPLSVLTEIKVSCNDAASDRYR